MATDTDWVSFSQWKCGPHSIRRLMMLPTGDPLLSRRNGIVTLNFGADKGGEEDRILQFTLLCYQACTRREAENNRNFETVCQSKWRRLLGRYITGKYTLCDPFQAFS